jgi:hypothetical protein
MLLVFDDACLRLVTNLEDLDRGHMLPMTGAD